MNAQPCRPTFCRTPRRLLPRSTNSWNDPACAPPALSRRFSAINLGSDEADLLGVAEGTAGLRIQRMSYLGSGRVAEFTRSTYRGDAYDFVVELRLAS